jgi:hypothetical protein
MSLTIDLDLVKLSEEMQRYVTELGHDGPTVVITQGRLLLETLIRITPPHSLKEGRAAIARDLRRALGLLNERTIRNDSLRKALRSGDVATVNAILERLRNKSPLGTFRAETFRKELHTGQRNARGRVARKTGTLALTPAAARKYLKEVQGRSGQAKGAFAPALHAVGGKASGWIEKHGGKYGDVSDVHLQPGEMDPRLTAINSARGIASLDDRDIGKAITLRGRAMLTHIDKLLELRARQTNLT